MMIQRYLTVTVGVLLIALTYLLIQHAVLNADQYQRVSDALRSLFLNDAALQRDVLKSRAGLLRNYDPLTEAIANLRRAVEALRSDAKATDKRANAEISRYIALVDAAVTDQETLVEVFKSRNALLQNSLAYFAHTIQQLDKIEDQPSPLSLEVGRLANAMLRLTADPGADNANDVSPPSSGWLVGRTTSLSRAFVRLFPMAV
jgi:hypothetical protein